MEQFALLGEKLSHSLSAPIHRKIYERMGWQADYTLWEIPRADFHMAAAMLKQRGLKGVNVTIPYKLEIMPQLSGVDDFARQVGAVNTVINRGGQLWGYNTDVWGLMEMLRFHRLPVSGHCCVLGSGGAARSACTALKALGADAVTVVSRSPQPQAWGDGVTFVGYDRLESLTGSLMINATPVGMHPNTAARPVTPAMMQGYSAFADLIYNPYETLFIQTARQMDRPGATGLYMLVAQAVKAEEIWWETPIPAQVTGAIYEEMLKEMNP